MTLEPDSSTVRRTATLSAVVFLTLAAATGLVAYNFREKGGSRVVTITDTTAGAIDSTSGSTDTTSVSSTDVAETTASSSDSYVSDSTIVAADSTVSDSSIAADGTLATATTRPSRVGTIGCPAIDGSATRVASFDAPPGQCIDTKASYSAVIQTSEGSITISLDQRNAPKTVNNFVYLARYHFFDGLDFHRVIPGFVIQGGDPEGNGQGGPGYEFADELPDRAGYPVGSVAMANSGANTNGSQFFIVSGDLGLALPGQYTAFAKVTKGLAVVAAIDKLGKQPAPDGTEYPPTRAVTITGITIKAVGEKAARIPGLSANTTVAATDSATADTTAA